MPTTFRNSKGQPIGTFDREDNVFRKQVSVKRHLLKIMDAWGIQENVIDELTDTGATIQIHEREDDKIYSISVDDFLAHAVVRDFGDGKQYFTSRKFFTTYARDSIQSGATTDDRGEEEGDTEEGGGARTAVREREAGSHPELFG